eukprot:14538-Rhodomonas_salina.1
MVRMAELDPVRVANATHRGAAGVGWKGVALDLHVRHALPAVVRAPHWAASARLRVRHAFPINHGQRIGSARLQCSSTFEFGLVWLWV